MSKVLFILKKREVTTDESNGNTSNYCLSSGLRNSAYFVVEMLVKHGIDASIVEVTDANDIDRVVTLNNPKTVIVEALWVTPDKFAELIPLHKDVDWIVRTHSEMPFLANEGIAIEWILAYVKLGIYVAPNSFRAYRDTMKIVEATDGPDATQYVILLPNYYQFKCEFVEYQEVHRKDRKTLKVGCFGAVRPMKNHLIQAIAAIEVAIDFDRVLEFHVNVSRVEEGSASLKNLRALFDGLGDRFQLIEHGWLSHDDFLLLIDDMDIGMQASFSESFNIVTADFISRGVPIVVSSEIDWMPEMFWIPETDSHAIATKMVEILRYDFPRFHFNFAIENLRKYNTKSKLLWLQTMSEL